MGHHIWAAALTLILSLGAMQAQSIADLRWEKRVILILTEDEKNPDFQTQLTQFKGVESALLDRRLAIFILQPDRYKVYFPFLPDWQSPSTYAKWRQKEGDFELLLIGLDGGVKLRKTEVVDRQEIFDLIDSMPMRMQEMKRKTPSSDGG